MQLESVLDSLFSIGPPRWHYYQGFHDIATVIVLLFRKRPSECTRITFQLTLCYLDPFLSLSIVEIQSLFLTKVYRIIKQEDGTLFEQLERIPNLFMLSWILTWYSHEIPQLPKIMRIFDEILATHPIFPIYLAAAILLSKRTEIDIVQKEKEMVGDDDELFGYLQKIVCNCNLPIVIELAYQLYEKESNDVELFKLYSLYNQIFFNKLPVGIQKQLKRGVVEKRKFKFGLLWIILPLIFVLIINQLIKIFNCN